MLTISVSRTDQRIPSQNSHCQCHTVAAVHEVHIYHTVCYISSVTLHAHNCETPVSCSRHLRNIQGECSVHLSCKFPSAFFFSTYSVYSFVQEWLWLKILRILWMRLWAGSNICWWLHPAVRLLNLCKNHSCNCVTTRVIISHVTYISVFMWNISVWKVQKEILWVMRFSQLCFGLWFYISEYNSSIQEKLVAWHRLICWGVKKIHW